MMTATPSRTLSGLVYMGTPAFASTILAALIDAGHRILAVYTQPPRPAGRGHRPQPSPVQLLAAQHRLPLRSPVSLRTPEAQTAFANLGAETAVIAAYGLILPKAILASFPLGCFNLHASLLPRWRSAAPIQRAVMAGDRETGVTVMKMEEGLDTGPIAMAGHIAIGPDATAGDVHDTLARHGAKMMVIAMAALQRATLQLTPQPEVGVTYATKIEKSETRIDWKQPVTGGATRCRRYQSYALV